MNKKHLISILKSIIINLRNLRTVKCTLRNAALNNFKRFAQIQQQKILHVFNKPSYIVEGKGKEKPVKTRAASYRKEISKDNKRRNLKSLDDVYGGITEKEQQSVYKEKKITKKKWNK